MILNSALLIKIFDNFILLYLLYLFKFLGNKMIYNLI